MKKRLDADSSFCRSSNLSEIARLITGTRWSGPAFFGLKAKQSNVSGNLAGERLAPDCALRHQVLTAEKFRGPFPPKWSRDYEWRSDRRSSRVSMTPPEKLKSVGATPVIKRAPRLNVRFCMPH